MFKEYKTSLKFNFCSTLNLFFKKRKKHCMHLLLPFFLKSIMRMTQKKLYCKIFCFVFIIPVTFPHISTHIFPAPLSHSGLLITCFPDKWLVGRGKETLYFMSNNYPSKQSERFKFPIAWFIPQMFKGFPPATIYIQVFFTLSKTLPGRCPQCDKGRTGANNPWRKLLATEVQRGLNHLLSSSPIHCHN